MKKLLTVVAVSACSFGLSIGAYAVKPVPPTPTAPEKVVGETKPAPEKATGEVKPLPMHSRADVIDVKARTFTSKRKDGVEVKHVLISSTEIHQGDTPAKLEDIKVGDYVSGLRQKVSPTEYTVIKITKFGPKEASQTATAKTSATKTEPAKPAPKKAQ